jgi:hypothetical protein
MTGGIFCHPYSLEKGGQEGNTEVKTPHVFIYLFEEQENYMNYKFTTILLTVFLLVVLGVSITQAAPQAHTPESGKLVAPAGNYDFTAHGTAWVNETPGQVKLLYKGWGAIARAKTTPAKYWVHIPLPFPSVLAGSALYVNYVEFCAQSTNGVNAKPVHMDVWDYAGKFVNVNIAWPADSAKHCFGYALAAPAWHQDGGISVQLQFSNTVDMVTLYKAWIRLTP